MNVPKIVESTNGARTRCRSEHSVSVASGTLFQLRQKTAEQNK